VNILAGSAIFIGNGGRSALRLACGINGVLSPRNASGSVNGGEQIHLALAAKLTKANAAQVEALKKYRSNGQQKVIVEHVHVYRGGQAAFIANATPREGVRK
jgi:hypothetical protein